MSSPLRLVSAPPPARSSTAVQFSAETVIASADKFASVRRRIQSLNRGRSAGAPHRPATLRLHPALSAPTADPVRQGEQLAEEALRRIERADRQLFDADLAPVVEDVFGIDVAVVATAEWFDGAAWSEDGAKVAVIGTSPWPGRQRFALAHLLCHLFVDDEHGLHVDASIEQLPAERERSERRANAFAEALLMPEPVLRAMTPAGGWNSASFAAVAAWLRLPAAAVTGRLHRLGLMTAEEEQRFAPLLGAEVAMLAGTTERYAERSRRAAQPRLPARLVQDAVHAGAGGLIAL